MKIESQLSFVFEQKSLEVKVGKCCTAEMCKQCDLAAGLQPEDNIMFEADGMFIKQMNIKLKDTLIPQHSHEYDHMSMLATGKVGVWKDGIFDGEFTAPCGIFIKAGVKHTFLSMSDNTIIYCVHNTMRTGQVEIKEEHQFKRSV